MLKKILLFLCFIGSINLTYSQDTIVYKLDLTKKRLPFGLTIKEFSSKPKMGLVFSGGGSRGFSQIGVLKAFEEHSIPIDFVVGTSMGSIVGGLYSSGYSVKAIDSIVTNTNWEDLFSSGEANRRELFIDQKITEDKAIFSLRFDGLTPVIPTSIISGQKVSNFLSLLEINAPIHFANSFDDLLFNYRAVATDLISGQKIVLSKGSLGKAMRASSSISLVLSPVQYDSLLLVDGGLVENVPANVAKELGSDVIIAVNSTSPLNLREELNSPWNVADQMVSIPMRVITNKASENADFLIIPELGDLKNSDFKSIKHSITEGYFAAIPFVDSIKNYRKSLVNKAIGYNNLFIKNFSVVINNKEIEKEILSAFNYSDSLSITNLFYKLYEIYDSGDFQDIWFEIISNGNENKIEVYAEKNPIIKSVLINGVTKLDLDKCYSVYNPLVNNTYNAKKICESSLRFLDLFREKGYSLAEIESIKFDNISKELVIKVSEGIVKNIVVEGNTNTNEDVILREFPIVSGDIFQYSQIEKGIIGIRSTNIFDELEVTIDKINTQNIIKIKVIEKEPAILRFGLRVDNENQAQISLDLRDENLYGTGTELGGTFLGGVRNRSFIIEYKSNRIFNTYFTYKLKGYYDLTDINYYVDEVIKNEKKFKRIKDSEYRQIIKGVSLGLGSQVGRLGNFIIEARYESNEIKNKNDYLGSIFKIDIAALKIDLTIDTQDRFPYPRNGFYIKTFYETAQQNFGGDVGYTKFFSDYLTTFTILKRHTITSRFELGFADETLPLSQQFSLGGQNSFFGYRDYEFRGRQIMLASLEYRYFLPIKLFFDAYIKFRYDLGSIWASKQQIRFKDLKHGLGTTLSMDTPIGPADFSVGRSFYLKQGLTKDIITWGEIFFYFTIGYAY